MRFLEKLVMDDGCVFFVWLRKKGFFVQVVTDLFLIWLKVGERVKE